MRGIIRFGRAPRRSLLVPAVVCALIVVSVAAAGTYTVGPLKLVSGPSPFAACTAGGTSTSTNYANTEVEPFVAVNPANPNNIIAVYQQDRWSDGGAHGLATAYSTNGGTTWNQTFAHFSTCAGGTVANGGDFDRASDPWVTFAPSGNAYQISLSFNAESPTNAVLVSKSTNGGASWGEPTTLIRDTSAFNFNDKESITADPTNSNNVYAVWDRIRKPGADKGSALFHSFAFRGDIVFSRTTNGGATWEPARDILNRNANVATLGNQIVVLPNGTLVDIFSLARPNHFSYAVIRSTDKGLTWSDPIIISQDLATDVLDPDTGADVRTGEGLPDIAVDRSNGTLYAVWSDGRFSGGAHSDIALSKSSDGGLTWTAPVKVNQTPVPVEAFTPSVEVASDGTVGVTYYDFRSNTSALGLPTDYWLAHCHTNCGSPAASWSEAHVAGPFDEETAPVAGGYFLGDYEGLISSGNSFRPLFIQTNSGNTANRTDAFFTTVGP